MSTVTGKRTTLLSTEQLERELHDLSARNAQIRADIEAARTRLGSSVGGLLGTEEVPRAAAMGPTAVSETTAQEGRQTAGSVFGQHQAAAMRFWGLETLIAADYPEPASQAPLPTRQFAGKTERAFEVASPSSSSPAFFVSGSARSEGPRLNSLEFFPVDRFAKDFIGIIYSPAEIVKDASNFVRWLTQPETNLVKPGTGIVHYILTGQANASVQGRAAEAEGWLDEAGFQADEDWLRSALPSDYPFALEYFGARLPFALVFVRDAEMLSKRLQALPPRMIVCPTHMPPGSPLYNAVIRDSSLPVLIAS